MVRLERTMQLRRGFRAQSWVRELTDYVNTVHQPPTVSVFRARFGNLSMIQWMADFEDLGALEEWQRNVGADRTYRELVKSIIG